LKKKEGKQIQFEKMRAKTRWKKSAQAQTNKQQQTAVEGDIWCSVERYIPKTEGRQN